MGTNVAIDRMPREECFVNLFFIDIFQQNFNFGGRNCLRIPSGNNENKKKPCRNKILHSFI